MPQYAPLFDVLQWNLPSRNCTFWERPLVKVPRTFPDSQDVEFFQWLWDIIWQLSGNILGTFMLFSILHTLTAEVGSSDQRMMLYLLPPGSTLRLQPVQPFFLFSLSPPLTVVGRSRLNNQTNCSKWCFYCWRAAKLSWGLTCASNGECGLYSTPNKVHKYKYNINK